MEIFNVYKSHCGGRKADGAVFREGGEQKQWNEQLETRGYVESVQTAVVSMRIIHVL